MAIAGNIVPFVLAKALNYTFPPRFEQTNWAQRVLTGAKVFADAGDLNLKNLETELHLLCIRWMKLVHEGMIKKEDLPATIQQTLLSENSQLEARPAIERFLRLLATLPVTSCECEWSFSVMSLALIHIHRDFHIDLELCLGDEETGSVSIM